MKPVKILLYSVLLLIIYSCGSTSYFQVFKATPSNKLIVNDNALFFEDENCKVSYNLWSQGGNIGFQFYNKTDNNMYLHLDESFFILNGFSYNYYGNRTYTETNSSAAANSSEVSLSSSVTGINQSDLIQNNRVSLSDATAVFRSSGTAVSYSEEKIICIPAKTTKIVSEYLINKSFIRDCELTKYPTKGNEKIKSYTKEQSPFTFSNRLAYSTGKNMNLIKFENEFYVSEISNHPESDIIETEYDKICGRKGTRLKKYFKKAPVNQFYVMYKKAF
jgi:hypothetical protein